MLRIHTIQNAEQAKKYYSVSDYFMDTPGEWLGDGAKQLGLAGRAKRDDFEKLCDNIDPLHGGSLTPLTREGRRVGWDFNFNATKSVSLALELTGDKRVIEAHKEAVRYAMRHVEQDMSTRVRAGGKNEDRETSNLIGMQVVHRTTRPNKDDQFRRVAPGGFPPGAPTDPDVPHSGIRLLRSSVRCETEHRVDQHRSRKREPLQQPVELIPLQPARPRAA